jgi:hypothetical protein
LAKGYFKKLGGGEELPRIFKYPGNVMEGLSPVEEPGTAGDIKNCIKTSQP